MNNKNIVSLKNVTKIYNGEVVLNNVSIDIKDEEFVTVLGPSGCGKTTMLLIIGGFVNPDEGSVLFDGNDITKLPPYKRQVNTIFQRYALFPHLNVYENIAFGLRIKKYNEKEIAIKVKQMLEIVNLSGFENRDINNLSGGQQQRVAIARALINEPKVLLLDEPLSALDLKLRKDMQVELKNIQRQTGITFIFVTHDQEEALSMSDTVIVLDNGQIQQIGTPEDIYNEPVNAFVADFIGESNIVDGVMKDDCLVSLDGVDFECVDSGFEKNEAVDVVIRPEDVDIVDFNKGMLNAEVTGVTFKGVYFEIIADVQGFKWMIQSTDIQHVNDKIGLYIEPDAFHIMKKSEYSGKFGDYSTFSDEIEQLSDLSYSEDEGNSGNE